jgi:hypothetical protein
MEQFKVGDNLLVQLIPKKPRLKHLDLFVPSLVPMELRMQYMVVTLEILQIVNVGSSLVVP